MCVAVLFAVLVGVAMALTLPKYPVNAVVFTVAVVLVLVGVSLTAEWNWQC